jgi:hypothetical protein
MYCIDSNGVSEYERLLCAVGRKMVYVVQIQNKVYEIFAFSDGDILVPTAYIQSAQCRL